MDKLSPFERTLISQNQRFIPRISEETQSKLRMLERDELRFEKVYDHVKNLSNNSTLLCKGIHDRQMG